MSEKDKKPDIRFNGFTDTWEQRKLGDVSIKIGSGKTPKGGKKNYEHEGIPLLRSQNIFNDKVNLNDVVYITTEIDEDMANSRVQKDDVLLNITGASIGRSAVYELPFKANVNQHVSIIRPSDGVNPYFIQLSITSQKGKKQIELNQAGGGREGLNFQNIAKMSFDFPSLEEQEKLGHFFVQLDNTIALHQRKYDKLVIVKKSMLKKMFPKDGANVPEIRFAGFTDSWEQRNALDIFESTADKGHPNLPVLSATQEFGMIKRDDTGINISHDKKNEMTYKRVLPGQFVIHLRSFQGGFAHSAIEGITSPAYTVFGFKELDKHFDYFWKYIFNSDAFIKRLEIVTYGIRDGRSISYNEFLTMPFYYPDYKEQRKIADFFTRIDHLITLHQCELEKLKNIKKSMLKKMLV